MIKRLILLSLAVLPLVACKHTTTINPDDYSGSAVMCDQFGHLSYGNITYNGTFTPSYQVTSPIQSCVLNQDGSVTVTTKLMTQPQQQ
jgi:hypothetical protein